MCWTLSGPVLRDAARLSQRYPPIARYGFFLVSQHGQLGAIPPPPFLSVSPLERNAKWRCDTPPPTRGVSQRYPRDTYENKAKRVRYPPPAILPRKVIAQYGQGPWKCSLVGSEPAFKLVILGSFFASLILLETPILSVFVQIPI